MRIYKLLLFGTICSVLANCTGQTSSNYKTLDIKKFEVKYAWLLPIEGDSIQMYCLLGAGVDKIPMSKRTDSIVNYWVAQHPNAKVLPVTTTAYTYKDSRKPHTSIYCWVIQQNDTLNNYLVRNGCYAKKEMERNKTWEEVPEEKKRLEAETTFPVSEYPLPKIEMLIDKKLDDNFMQQITSAEKFAIKNKLGIWTDKETNASR